MKKVRIVVSGSVTGVYFRSFIRDRAMELGLTGYTRNMSPKHVEVIIEGHEAKVQKIIDLCKQGPRGAAIDNIKVEVLPPKQEFKTFRVKY